ncbi:MAG: hypothetical protein Q7U54_15590 [Bacteroidales bacterium]|nr:hypothetical protein [Bacteroidales bacterium]
MLLENNLDDIFTSYDESIFSDGSIDPMGLRIIWTSLGNKIFYNKINTISTDIRYYTLNLFHHYLLYKCTVDWADKINGLVRKPPYINKSDLYEGILIFLENLLTRSTYEAPKMQPSNYTVPGLSKLKGLLLKDDKDNNGNKLVVKRTSGILVRQYLLGIHGRHKGPFMQMGILNSNSEVPYNNTALWENVGLLFSGNPWKSAAKNLLSLIDSKILSVVPKSGKEIEYKIEEILNPIIIKAYASILTPSLYSGDTVKSFWERQLGLHQGTAANLFTAYKEFTDKSNYQGIIEKAKDEYKDEIINAIVAIEPFITCIDKMAKRILLRGTSFINDELITTANYWLNLTTIQIDKMEAFLSDVFFNPEAISRLRRLMKIYTSSKQSINPPIEFIKQLIQYHNEIMKSRGHMHWVSIGSDNKITIHKSLYFTNAELEKLKQPSWINNYYLSTLDSLYKGLNLTNEVI